MWQISPSVQSAGSSGSVWLGQEPFAFVEPNGPRRYLERVGEFSDQHDSTLPLDLLLRKKVYGRSRERSEDVSSRPARAGAAMLGKYHE